MFIIDMIIMSITANLGLIAFSAIVIATVLIAAFGEKWLEATIDKDPEWWNKEIDYLNIKAVWNHYTKK